MGGQGQVWLHLLLATQLAGLELAFGEGAAAQPDCPVGAEDPQQQAAAQDLASCSDEGDETPGPTFAFRHPVMSTPEEDGPFPCLPEKPTCARTPWWSQWNELQTRRLVQYDFVGPGLVTEFRFVEAIWLLWRWPEGRELLQQAADDAVLIGSSGEAVFQSVFAAYLKDQHQIVVNRAFTETPTWMVASVLAHELAHAADFGAAARTEQTYEECIAREQQAYQVEARFLSWLSEGFGRLPSPEVARRSFRSEDYTLFMNLRNIATSEDVDAVALDAYRRSCRGP